MPRNPMRVESRVNHLSYVLELLASLFYVIAAVFIISSFSQFVQPSMYILASGGFWLPIFYSLAIASTITLFIVSFANLMHARSRRSYRYAVMVSLVAGISWLGLSAGSAFLTTLVVIGFVLSMVGSAFGMIE